METLNKDKFLIIKNIKNFILSMEKLLVTFPKKDIITRDKMYNDTLELLELVMKANLETDIVLKRRYKIEALALIQKIDFYLERAYYLKYISENQCTIKSNELLKINKMLYIWCKNE